MSGDDDLGTCRHGFFHPNQESQLIDVGKRGFGLIEDIESTAFQTMIEKRHKALAMRLLMKTHTTITLQQIRSQSIHFGSHIIETFRSKEKRISVAHIGTDGTQFLMQTRMSGHGAEPEILATSFGIHAQESSHRFQQSRFARTVLTHNVGHALVKFQRAQFAHHRQVERIAIIIRSLVLIPDGTQKYVLSVDVHIDCYIRKRGCTHMHPLLFA